MHTHQQPEPNMHVAPSENHVNKPVSAATKQSVSKKRQGRGAAAWLGGPRLAAPAKRAVLVAHICGALDAGNP